MSQQLARFQTLFEPALTDFFEKTPPHPLFNGREMFAHIRQYTEQGGKRMRPALLYYVSQSFVQDQQPVVLQLGVACELMQSSLLILDDIMDEADTRRGKRALHKVYEKDIAPELAARYGESAGMLAGVAAGYLGLQAIEMAGFSLETTQQLLALYRQVMIDEAYGQALDVQLAARRTANREAVLQVYRYKTARYTTEMPLVMAGIATRQSTEILTQLEKTGELMGVSFQAKDDLLGIFGKSEKVGKSVLSDIREGKQTLLLVETLARVEGTARERFNQLYGKHDLSEEDALEVRKTMVDCGARAAVEADVAQLLTEARESLLALLPESAGRDFVVDLIDQIGAREN